MLISFLVMYQRVFFCFSLTKLMATLTVYAFDVLHYAFLIALQT